VFQAAGGTVPLPATIPTIAWPAADINMMICGLAAAIRNAAGDWRRYVEVALDGLRPR
jgi:hypothetical protein